MRSAGMPLTIGYTGHPWDRALGQYFAPFRYYTPATTRWNMRDPLGFVDGPNVYAYVAGNPVMRTDPLGLCPVTPEQGEIIRTHALNWINVPRKEGAGDNSNRENGVDCSGLVCRIYEDAELPYPYTPTRQWPPPDFERADTPQNGDVVKWPGHVGIYDNGNVIHSSTSAKKVVKTPMKYMPKNPEYYRRRMPDNNDCPE